MSFFRLSIDKLLTKLPTPVQFNESQKAMIDGLNENRFFVHIAADVQVSLMQLLY